MKKLLAVIVCLTLVLSCFALSAIADDELDNGETNQTTVESQPTEQSSTEESSTEETSAEETTEQSSTEEEEPPIDYNNNVVITNLKGEVVDYYSVVSDDLRNCLQSGLDLIRDRANELYTISLPKGVYYANSSLNVYSNTKIDFNGSTVYRGRGVDGAIVRFGRKSEADYAAYDGFKNIVITNAILDAQENGTGSYIRFAHAEDVQITNITFTNSKNVHHLLTFAACNNITVDNCVFSNMNVADINKYNCEAIQIDVIKEEYFSDYGKYDATPTKNVSVTNCTFKNLQRGLGSHTGVAGHYFENMTFENNYFENITGYAIRATAYRHSKINNNVIKNCGSGILFGNVTAENLGNFCAAFNSGDQVITKTYSEIKNNTIDLVDTSYQNVQFGINILGKKVTSATDQYGGNLSGDFRVSALDIENNVITSSIKNNNCYGIWVSGALGSSSNSSSDFKVLNNSYTTSGSSTTSKLIHGLKILNSSNVYASNNSFVDKKASKGILNSGIVVDGSTGILLDNNTITNTTNYGIRLANTTNNVVSKSKITNTKNYGIYLSEKTNGAKINSNTLNKISIGVYLNSSAAASTINENKISNTTSHGIQLNDTTKASNIKTNTISSPKGSGIYITKKAKGGNIEANSVCNSKGVAIYLNMSASATQITKNKIDIANKTLNAIGLNNSATVSKINGNLINCKKSTGSSKLKVYCKNGIAINSAKCNVKQINSNTINNCVNAGIAIYNVKSKSKIQKNTIKVCKYGIQYKKGSLSKNKISKASAKKIVKI